MKTRRLFLIAAFVLMALMAGAQQPIQISVIPNPPFSPRAGDYVDQPSRFFQLVITNTSGSTYNYYLSFKLEMIFPDIASAEVPPGRPPHVPLTLAPYQTVVVSHSMLDQAFRHLKLSDLITENIDQTNYGAGTSNMLPEGTYRICFTALDFDSPWGQVVPLSNPGGSCATFSICYSAMAPVLASPATCVMNLDNDTLAITNPMVISWMPPAFSCGGAIANFVYDLRVVEVMPGQDLQTAIDFNPSALEFSGLSATTIVVDTLVFPLVFHRAQRYAVQITAREAMETGNIIIANEGHSPICTFVWGTMSQVVVDPQITEPPEEEPEEPQEDSTFETPIVIHDPGDSTDPNCLAEAPTNTTPYDGSLSGKTVRVGHFSMNVASAVPAGDGWTGTGTINWNPIGAPLRIRVEFANIKVNTQLEMFAGQVFSQAETQLDDFVPQDLKKALGWVDDQVNYPSQFGINVPSIYKQKIQGYQQYIKTQARTIQQLTGDFNLPVRLPSAIPSTDIDIGIVGMVFTPTTARMNTMAVFKIPESVPLATNAEWLAFVGQGMCFTPNILLSANEANLFLAADLDIEIGGGFKLNFKRATQLGNTNDGTYLKWNYEGFDEARLDFDVQLPSVIRGEFPDGKPNPAQRISASFSTWFSDWNNWIATASVPDFQVSGLPSFGFSATNIVYDHSVTANPQGIRYPEGYNAPGAAWKGFYMQQLAVKLPPEFKSLTTGQQRAEFSVNHMIIDDQGVSCDILAVRPLETGVLGGCAFAIDTIDVRLLRSEFSKTGIAGRITMPVANDPLLYSGVLKSVKDELDYEFVIHPESDIKMPIWVAQLNIYQSSGLIVKKDSHGAAVNFLLHGDISLGNSYSINPLPYKFHMPGIHFENFGIGNRNPQTLAPEFYMSEGTWSQASAQKKLGPFGVGIKTPKPYFRGGEFGMKIETDFSIVEKFACKTTLDVVGELHWNPAQNLLPSKADLKTIRLDEIEVSGDFGPVDITGNLKFYYDDPTYGDGLKGKVRATFEPLVTVDATAQFGRTPGTSSYDYWYVDAHAKFDRVISVFYPVGFGGFGGGVFYNMEMSNLSSNPEQMLEGQTGDLESTDPSESASGVVYSPKKGSIGFKAGTTLALSNEVGGGNVMNASVWVTSSYANGAFSSLLLEGEGFVISNYPENDDHLVSAIMKLGYDNKTKNLDLTLNIEADFLVGKALIPITFHAKTADKKWYMHLGDPHGRRIQADLIDVKSGPLKVYLGANAYFALGNDLPDGRLPAPPPEIVQFLNLSSLSQHRASLETIPRKGMIFGTQIRGSLDLDLVVYCSLTAIAGFDVALTHDPNRSCNNNPAGFKGWYGTGQVYGYFDGDVGIKVNVWFFKGKASLCQLTAGAFLRGGMPDPFWAYGKARVRGSILGGMIKVSTSVEMKVGEQCYPDGDPLANIRVLEDIQPAHETFNDARQSEPESIFAIPRITANLDLSDGLQTIIHAIEAPPSRKYPDGEFRQYKFQINTIRLHQGVNGDLPENASDGMAMEFKVANHPNRTQVNVLRNESFLPNTNYAIRVVADAKQKYGTVWDNPTIDGERKERLETMVRYFRTGPRPDSFEQNVLASYPMDRQRYFNKWGDYVLVLNNEQNYIFEDTGRPVEAWIRQLEENPDGSAYSQKVSYNVANRRIGFTDVNKAALQPQVLYNLSVVRVNLAKQEEFMAKMAEERRRLELKNLATNQLSNYVITGGGLTYEQAYDITTTPIHTDLQSANINSGITSGSSLQTSDNLLVNTTTTGTSSYPSGYGSLDQPSAFPSGNLTTYPSLQNTQPGIQAGTGSINLQLEQPLELLDMLTVEEYNQQMVSDTIDYREMKLLQEKFNITYLDTLFSITFSVSQYGTLQQKLDAYNSLVRMPGTGILTGISSPFVSVQQAEPFEELDIVGLGTTIYHIYGYMAPVKPLLKFEEEYNQSLNDDLHWKYHFFDRIHYIESFCGKGTFKPRSDVDYILNGKGLTVSYGNTAINRSNTYFPLDFPRQATDHFPSRNMRLLDMQEGFNFPPPISSWELNPNVPLRIENPMRVTYRARSVRYRLMDDIEALRQFNEEFKLLAVEFENTNGEGRKNKARNWIAENKMIVGEAGNTRIEMPAYQLVYFYTLKGQTSFPLWEWLKVGAEATPLLPTRNYPRRDLNVKMLNIRGSQLDGQGQGWNYIQQYGEKIPIVY